MQVCPTSGLVLPAKFIDEKTSLKNSINEWLENALKSCKHIKDNFFVVLHAKFNPHNPEEFLMDAPKVTFKLPPFMSNSMVWWVSPQKGICEILWMVQRKRKGEKLKVEFNKDGVAYLQAKGAMPS